MLRLSPLPRDLGQRLDAVPELQFLQPRLSAWRTRAVDLSEGEVRAVRAVLKWKLIPEAESAQIRAADDIARTIANHLRTDWDALIDTLTGSIGE